MEQVTALYDLRHRISTYDFFTWLCYVKTKGANEIVIQADEIAARKWRVEEVRKRLKNYILPGPALAGLPCRLGSDGDPSGSYQIYDLAALGKIARLRSVLPPASHRYTVTIRETFFNTHKNSDRGLWLEFAERIGALVIEDHSRKPIGLHERVALYAGAKMNFGVPNGPLGMLQLTEYPVTVVCDPATTAKGFAGHRVAVGDQLPIALPGQRLVWERPTLKVLMDEFEKCQS